MEETTNKSTKLTNSRETYNPEGDVTYTIPVIGNQAEAESTKYNEEKANAVVTNNLTTTDNQEEANATVPVEHISTDTESDHTTDNVSDDTINHVPGDSANDVSDATADESTKQNEANETDLAEELIGAQHVLNMIVRHKNQIKAEPTMQNDEEINSNMTEEPNDVKDILDEKAETSNLTKTKTTTDLQTNQEEANITTPNETTPAYNISDETTAKSTEPNHAENSDPEKQPTGSYDKQKDKKKTNSVILSNLVSTEERPDEAESMVNVKISQMEANKTTTNEPTFDDNLPDEPTEQNCREYSDVEKVLIGSYHDQQDANISTNLVVTEEPTCEDNVSHEITA